MSFVSDSAEFLVLGWLCLSFWGWVGCLRMSFGVTETIARRRNCVEVAMVAGWLAGFASALLSYFPAYSSTVALDREGSSTYCTGSPKTAWENGSRGNGKAI